MLTSGRPVDARAAAWKAVNVLPEVGTLIPPTMPETRGQVRKDLREEP